MRNAKIITVGDELLIGQVIDSNSAWIASRLHEINIAVSEILTISDHLEHIIEALERSADVDMVLITGGLGPTKDDMTKKALISFLDDEMRFDDQTYERILKLFERIQKTPTDAHKAQAYMPSKAKLLLNDMGTAPGMLFQHKNQLIISMPGVPYEMKFIMDKHVIPMLQSQSEEQLYHKTIRTAGEGESRIAQRIADILDEMPPEIKVAYLPSVASVRIRLSVIGGEQKKEIVDDFVQKIASRLGNYVYGYDHDELSAVIGEMLLAEEATVATAESCTGGTIAQKITAIPGSSTYFKGSVIAYSNEVKMKTLRVSERTLQQFGAVSEETVREMVKGVINHIESDYGIAVSGIAGPGGGSAEKPVGTIHIAVGNKDRIMTKKWHLSRDRKINIEYASIVALNMLRLFLDQA